MFQVPNGDEITLKRNKIGKIKSNFVLFVIFVNCSIF